MGSTDPLWMARTLLLDSLLFLRLLPDSASLVADLGSGAGLPGVPIALVRPDLRLTLIEARERRVSFLSTVVRELGLRNVRVVKARAESALAELKATFDVVLMRCAGEPAALLPVASRLTRAGGLVIASGPPSRGPLGLGEWAEVPGIEPDTRRLFVVLRT